MFWYAVVLLLVLCELGIYVIYIVGLSLILGLVLHDLLSLPLFMAIVSAFFSGKIPVYHDADANDEVNDVGDDDDEATAARQVDDRRLLLLLLWGIGSRDAYQS